MKRLLQIVLIILLFAGEIVSQQVIGKIVDENQNALPSIDLKLYSNPNVYTTSTLADGSFSFTITGVRDEQLPTGYSVSNNYPNPFNPTTRIGITLPVSSKVMIEVFNLLGQSVGEEIDKTLSAGTNYVDIELNGLPNGLYLIRIKIDDQYTVIKKAMLVYNSQHLSVSGEVSNSQFNKSSNTNVVHDTKLDSLVATSTITGRKAFVALPNITGNLLNLGNLIIERYCPSQPTVTYSGKVYNTVSIGNQCWLKENLDVGTKINISQNSTDNGIIEKYCYNDDNSNCNTYGGLYKWDEAMQYSTIEGAQGICPSGWHLPSDYDWKKLEMNLDMSQSEADLYDAWRGTNEGGELKETETLHWNSPNTNATNLSGFTALAGGQINGNNVFSEIGYYGHWQVATTNYDDAFRRSLGYDKGQINRYSTWKVCGYSVRCIRDENLGQVPQPPTLSFPSDKAVNVTTAPILSWEAVGDAVSYTLQVSENSDFTSFIFDQNGLTNAYKQINGLNDSTQYYWRVNATNMYGTSDWSSEYLFTTRANQSQYLTTVSATIGPSGGEIDLGDGTILLILENTFADSIEISISKPKYSEPFSQSGIKYIQLEPSGIILNQPIILQTSYEDFSDFGEDMIAVYSYNEKINTWERLEIFQDEDLNIVAVLIEHFSWLFPIMERPLDMVMEIPGEYLSKADIIYTLTNGIWNPGHTGLYLGTNDFSSWTNDGQTTIESSPWCGLKPDGVQFNTLNEFQNPSYCGDHIYMGARRYNGTITNEDRTKIAEFAVGKLDNGYYNVGDFLNLFSGRGQYNFTNESSCYCSGLVEGAYDFADKSIRESFYEYPGVMPIEQFVRTVPINEITVKAGTHLQVPIKGVVLDKSNKKYTDDPSKSLLSTTNLPGGASFFNNILNWTPGESNVGNTYNIYFTLIATVGKKEYIRTQNLIIHVIAGYGTVPDAPTLLSPENGEVNVSLTPTLSWNVSNGAMSYRLQVAISDQFTSPVFDESNITSTIRQVSGLSNNASYYWRVNATNSYGTSSWSNSRYFTTVSGATTGISCPGLPTITDSRDGKVYNTVKIGNQCWLKENLNVGIKIDGIQSQTNNDTIQKYCYNNDPNNCNTYGGLYQWDEAMQYSTTPGARGICPTGWHIPTLVEFDTLKAAVNDDGNALKAIGQGSDAGVGTNTSGFSALLAGFRYYDGPFSHLNLLVNFWSSTKFSTTLAYTMAMYTNNSDILRYDAGKENGFSLRCLKN